MTTTENDIYSSILLSHIKGIGPVNSNRLISHYGSAEAVLNNIDDIVRIFPKVGQLIKSQISGNDWAKKETEKEIEFIEKHNISAITQNSRQYPSRLRECIDAPIIVFFKGSCALNHKHAISIVGTRKSTPYGSIAVENFINDLAGEIDDLVIISGLAYGIDCCAHRYSLRNNIETIGVLAHGLDIIYPYSNRQLAKEMIHTGGLITEFTSGTTPERGNFISRNRIIAGMSDAVIVAETGEKGGSIITANIALSYNKDLFAFPGRIDDISSKGCNNLIKDNKAGLITSAEDFLNQMNWSRKSEKSKQRQLKVEFDCNEKEGQIIDLLRENGEMHINRMAIETSIPIHQLSSTLMDLEIKCIVRSFPGAIYKLVKY
jgi:DNA protecting protein DprA